MIIKPSGMTSYIWYRGEGKGVSKFGYHEDNQDRTMSQKPKTERVLGRLGGTDRSVLSCIPEREIIEIVDWKAVVTFWMR